MKTTEVVDVDLASQIYGLAAEGFKGSTTELASSLGLGALSPTAAGQLAAKVRALVEPLGGIKVSISFKAAGNNKLVKIEKKKGYRAKAPNFVLSGTAPQPKGSSEGHDPTDSRILELQSENLHLSAELRAQTLAFRAASREAGLFKAVVDELSPLIKPLTAPPPKIIVPKKGAITEHLVMHLSDGHHDEVVRPEEVGGLEQYDFQISCARAERYVDTVLEWTQDTLSPKFNFSDLWILAYGDHTSGEIHGHTSRSYYRNQFKNCLAIGQLHALMYRDLAPHFERVHVVYLPGNHGRRSVKKDFGGAHDNWDYLVAEFAKQQCAGLGNIDFLIPDTFSVNLDINGVGFNLSHGDDVRGNSGIPFYGMVRRQKSLIALSGVSGTGGPRIRYFCMGHHHVASSLSDIDGELLVNGAWVGTDAYAYNSFSGYREPCQWIHGCNPKHGITWRLGVKLRHEGELAGPKRYLIDGGRDVGPVDVRA